MEDVEAFLRANPGFLAANPALYDVLAPPRRVHGPALADHMAAMLHQARARITEAVRAGSDAAADRRAAEDFSRRVHETVVALMRAADPTWLVMHELPGLLRVDAARLCSECGRPEGAAPLPRGAVATVLGHRAAVARPARPDPLLHGEAVALATQEALVRVPLVGGQALLALASRDDQGLAGATTATLAFLGQAIGAALDRA
jgi:uncharacterized protein YigA (DUF484 family)